MTATGGGPKVRLATRAGQYERRRVTITLTDTQRDSIDALLGSGLFGLNRIDLIRRLLDERLQQLTDRGWLRMATGKAK